MAKARGGGAWVYVMPRDDTQIQHTSGVVWMCVVSVYICIDLKSVEVTR